MLLDLPSLPSPSSRRCPLRAEAVTCRFDAVCPEHELIGLDRRSARRCLRRRRRGRCIPKALVVARCPKTSRRDRFQQFLRASSWPWLPTAGATIVRRLTAEKQKAARFRGPLPSGLGWTGGDVLSPSSAEHGVDDVDDAVRLVDVGDGHLWRVSPDSSHTQSLPSFIEKVSMPPATVLASNLPPSFSISAMIACGRPVARRRRGR